MATMTPPEAAAITASLLPALQARPDRARARRRRRAYRRRGQALSRLRERHRRQRVRLRRSRPAQALHAGGRGADSRLEPLSHRPRRAPGATPGRAVVRRPGVLLQLGRGSRTRARSSSRAAGRGASVGAAKHEIIALRGAFHGRLFAIARGDRPAELPRAVPAARRRRSIVERDIEDLAARARSRRRSRR